VIIFAQPNVEFIRNFDNDGHDSFQDVYTVSGGGLIACGATSGSGNMSPGAYYVVRTDDDGDEIWHYAGEQEEAMAYSIIEADNGDFVFGGFRNDQFNASRLSADGELIWTTDYIEGTCEAVIELKNGDFLLGGRSGLGRLILIDGEGDVIWSRAYDGGRLSRFHALRDAVDGAIAVGAAQAQVWAVKVDIEDGDIIWSNFYNPRHTSTALSMVSSHDGRFVLTGGFGPYLLKINSDGSFAWNETYDDEELQEGYCVTRLRDGGFAIVGRYWTEQQFRPFCLRTDTHGNPRWQAKYDLNNNNLIRPDAKFRSVTVNGHDEIIAAGIAMNRRNDTSDGFLMKLEPDIPNQQNIVISPEDTSLFVLPDTPVTFSVTMEDYMAGLLDYLWLSNDSIVDHDSTYGETFEELGESIIECRITYDELTISIRWHVTVTDLYIYSHTPDTLNLTLRRGTTLDFSIDSIAALYDEQEVDFLWTLVKEGEAREEISEEDRVTVEFLRSGRYALEGLAYVADQANDAVAWRINVRGAIWSFLPEQTSLTVPLDTAIEFQVIPTVYDMANIYEWYYDGDRVMGDTIATLRFSSVGEHLVEAVVSDSVESDTVRWSVNVVDPEEAGEDEFRIKCIVLSRCLQSGNFVSCDKSFSGGAAV